MALKRANKENEDRIAAAVKQYRAFKDDPKLKSILADDNKDFSAQEIEDIIQGLSLPEDSVVVVKKQPNKGIPLDSIDYKNLVGENFDEYQEIIEGLSLREQYDFEQYYASGIIKKKWNEDTGVPDDKLIGIKINNSNPINVTRIPLQMALELNRQILNKDNPPSNSRYFLLKKG